MEANLTLSSDCYGTQRQSGAATYVLYLVVAGKSKFLNLIDLRGIVGRLTGLHVAEVGFMTRFQVR
jgi:hypothetical protein